MTRPVRRSTPLSVSMALEALTEQVEAHTEAVSNELRQRTIRNNLIIDAIDGGVAYKKLTQITGLSRDRLWTIAHQPRRSV